MRSHRSTRTGRIAAAVAGSMLCAGIAHAQTTAGVSPAQSLLDSSFVLNLGGFLVQTDTKARLDGSSTTHPEIDFDRTFGKPDDATRIRADALWRINPKHHLRFMYFDNTIDRSRVLDETLNWGDHTFHVGGRVDSRTEFTIAALAYEYAFISQPGFELSGSLGVHYMDVALRLTGNASVTNPDGTVSASGNRTKEASAPMPLPLIGIRAAWAVSSNWVIDVQGQVFKAEIDEFDGRVTDLRASATWMFNKNFGLGLGFNTFITKVEAEKSSFNGALRLGYSGVQLFVTGAF